MSSKSNIRYAFEPVRTLAFGSITGAYVAVGTAITNPALQLIFSNFTDAPVMISLDGVNDAFPLAANTSFVDDIASNKEAASGMGAGGLWLQANAKIYVKQITAPTTGSFYISVAYAAGV